MSQMVVEPVFMPNKGIDMTKPEQFLKNVFSPYSRNMFIYNEKVQGRQGISKFDDYQFPDDILIIDQFWKEDASYDLIVGTKRDIAKYDFGNTRWDFLTPLYQTGKVKLVNGSAIVRGGLEVDNCDTDPVAWADGSGGDVTPSRNTTSPQDGTAFVRLTVAAGAGVELLAYHDITSIDLSGYKAIGFWFRSDISLNAGDLQFLLDDTVACPSPLKTLNIPAIVANTWTWVNLALGDASGLTGVVSIGITQAVDKGAMVIDIDQIVAGTFTTAVKANDFFKQGSGSIHSDSTWYVVSAVDSDTQFTLTAVYAGSTASQQAYVVRDTFTGSDNDLWSRTEFLDDSLGEIWVAVNGVDPPIYYSGTGQVTPLTGLPAGFTTAKYVTQFFNRIVFAWCVEGGQNQPIRVRWSAAGNANSYNSLHQNDLEQPDFTYWIVGMTPYNDYMIIPKESGAYVMRPVDNDNIFEFAFSNQFFGNFAAFSLVNIGGRIHYFGYENRFRIATLIDDKPVFDPIAPYTRTLEPNAAQYIYGWQLDYRDQIRWMLPYDSVNSVQPLVFYDYKEGVIEIWEYNHATGFSCIGEYLQSTDLYVDDPTWGEYYVDEQDDYWDTRAFLASAPVILYGGRNGYVYIADIGLTDDGLSYNRIFESSRLDFKRPHRKKRCWKQRFRFDAETTGSVTVKMKKDDKGTFESESKTISLIETSKDIINKDITWDKEFENMKVRIEATNHFALHGFLNWISDKGKVTG